MLKRRILSVLFFIAFLISSMGSFSPVRTSAILTDHQNVLYSEKGENLQILTENEEFTFAVVLDTQGLSESESGADMLRGAFRWLAEIR